MPHGDPSLGARELPALCGCRWGRGTRHRDLDSGSWKTRSFLKAVTAGHGQRLL